MTMYPTYATYQECATNEDLRRYYSSMPGYSDFALYPVFQQQQQSFHFWPERLMVSNSTDEATSLDKLATTFLDLDGIHWAENGMPTSHPSMTFRRETAAVVSRQDTLHKETDSVSTSTEARSKDDDDDTVFGRKTYTCSDDDCKKNFTTVAHLKRHQKIHSGVRPFKCLIKDCKRDFTRRDNMIHHSKNHAKAVGLELTQEQIDATRVTPKQQEGAKIKKLAEELNFLKQNRQPVVLPLGFLEPGTLQNTSVSTPL